MSVTQNHIVVGIGASAGGLDAIQQLFNELPNDLGISFVIIQHLSPNFKSLMPELLAKHTNMKIFTAEDKQEVKPNCIYLNDRNKNVHIKGNKLYLLDKGPKNNLNLPIDIFFQTLGEEFQESGIGVILSGTGSDGSVGIKSIKKGGGTVIVQKPETAEFDGMPKSAIRTNIVDYILSPKEISDIIQKIALNPLLPNDNLTKTSSEEYFTEILNELSTITTIDFSGYKRNTLLRRLEKRMSISNVKTLKEYAQILKKNDQEVRALKQDFLIGVTCFFRDENAFFFLKENVIPALCNKLSKLRIWCAGCSTGEEAYSMAILLDEYIEENGLNVDFKIFATDIDDRAIEIASLGEYNREATASLGKYADSYFNKSGNKLTVEKHIRERIVFSQHDLLKDPPFIRMDFISCRNLLIYLNNDSQQHVIQNFKFALNKNGFLFLGPSESLGKTARNFKVLDSRWNIFQNLTNHSYASINSPGNESLLGAGRHNHDNKSGRLVIQRENPDNIYHRYLSKRFSPSTIFVDREYNIRFIKGDAGKKLLHNEGVFDNNLLKIVPPELAIMLRTGLSQLKNDKREIEIKNVQLEVHGEKLKFDIFFHLPDEKSECNDHYLIHFSDNYRLGEDTVAIQSVNSDEISKRRISDLEDELHETKFDLQSVVEELETSNEELQSSNEELKASNEELQSTNEELQSVNEELYTVNSEFQEKNRELILLNDDMNNLIDNTDIGTLFLDSNLNIRKYTPALKAVFNLHESDVGRPISSFASIFSSEISELIIQHTKDVLKNLVNLEEEITNNDGKVLLMRILPFITEERKVDGVIITFVDISKIKSFEAKLQDSEKKYRLLFENMKEGFAHAKIIQDDNGKAIDWEYITVNKAFEEMLHLKRKDVIGKRVTEIIPSIKDEDVDWIELLGDTALNGTSHYIESTSKLTNTHNALYSFSPAKGEWAATFWDITKIKNAELKLMRSENLFKSIFEGAGIGIATVSKEGKMLSVNPQLANFLGFTKEELLTLNFKDFTHPNDLGGDLENLEKVLSGEIAGYTMDKRYVKKLGETVWAQLTVTTVKDSNTNEILYFVALIKDISNEKKAALALGRERLFKERLLETSPNGIYIYNVLTGKNEYVNERYTEILGYTLEDINALNQDEFMKLFHPDDIKDIVSHMEEVLKGTEKVNIQYRFKHKNGNWVDCYSVDSPFEKDKEGKVTKFFGSFIETSLPAEDCKACDVVINNKNN